MFELNTTRSLAAAKMGDEDGNISKTLGGLQLSWWQMLEQWRSHWGATTFIECKSLFKPPSSA